MAMGIVVRCAVCGGLELEPLPGRDRVQAEPSPGIRVHAADCLVIWNAADDAQRIEWGVQAVRWREAS